MGCGHPWGGFVGARRGGSSVPLEISVRSKHRWAPGCLHPASRCPPRNGGGCSVLPGLGCAGLPRSPSPRLSSPAPRHLKMKNEEGRLGGCLLSVARSRELFSLLSSPFSFSPPSWLSMKRPRAAGGWAAWPPTQLPSFPGGPYSWLKLPIDFSAHKRPQSTRK